MFDYSSDGTAPARAQVWSRVPLQPLTPGSLTPFSYSVLAEIMGRGWYNYYDRLGFSPTPRTRILRQYQGHPYLNLTVSAKLDAEQAGLEPMTLQVNGRPLPVCAWEKPGFLAGLSMGRAQKRVETLINELSDQAAAVVTKARAWYTKTQELNWSQAEILQVMEEIERVSLDSTTLYFAARHNLELAYNRLIHLLGSTAYPASLNLINGAICDLGELLETEMTLRLVEMAEPAGRHTNLVDWLRAVSKGASPEDPPDAEFAEALDDYLRHYGHRCSGEGEIRTPRWLQDPAPVLLGILGCIDQNAHKPAKLPAGQNLQRLLESVPRKQQKDAEGLVQRIRQLLRLGSNALNATAYILAGTRTWVLAAGHEALADGRIAELDDIYFFELEEIKQMMTGEWNISSLDEIRATAERRRTENAEWETATPGEVLLGDVEAVPVAKGLPGANGQFTGPLRRWNEPRPHNCQGAVVGVRQLDSGWAVLLPVAHGLVTASGTPLDPIVAAARYWHIPTILGMGDAYTHLVDGAQTTVNADEVYVDQ